MSGEWMLIAVAGGVMLLLMGLVVLSRNDSLNGIKSKTVGDGQYGTARWATPREIRKTFRHVAFRPDQWRKGEDRPKAQGLVLGSIGKKGHVTALVD